MNKIYCHVLWLYYLNWYKIFIMEELVTPLDTHLIAGVLQQIHKVNYMIDFHNLHGESSSQYERQREGFLEELNELLSDFRIHVNINVLANT
jgi:hypothetical protein